MVRTARLVPTVFALLACCVLAASATSAVAHDGHDERNLGIAAQNGLRPGLHGMGGGLSDEPVQRRPPSIGDGLGSGTNGLGSGSGGFGQMQGNSIGNYGAGSIGERGPGGLGALRGDSILTEPPRPR